MAKKQASAPQIRTVILLLTTVILCLLAVLSCIQVVKQFVTVKHIDIEGIRRYDREDIVAACGILPRERLYGLDNRELEEALLQRCPFLETAKVQKKFPNRLSIQVTERKAPWYIQISGAKYALDEDLVVIDELRDTEGMTRLILPHVKQVISGTVPKFSESETELRKTVEVIAAIRSTSFHKRLTEVDLSSRWDIKMVVDGKFTVTMGDMTDFSAKLDAVREVLDSDRLEGAESGTIWAANPAVGVAVSVKKSPKPDDAGTEAENIPIETAPPAADTRPVLG